MFKKMFRRISLEMWVLKQKFKKEKKKDFWCDDWYLGSNRPHVWSKEFLNKHLTKKREELDAK
tara:strand:+ start:256 stop:444 length:189 start_codon:yes stop_codon:yes gene_type:complete